MVSSSTVVVAVKSKDADGRWMAGVIMSSEEISSDIAMVMVLKSVIVNGGIMISDEPTSVMGTLS